MAESNSDRWSYSKPPISGAQIRAARALLKWSVREFSDQCRISKSAITRGAGQRYAFDASTKSQYDPAGL
jgi:hypothetical protein